MADLVADGAPLELDLVGHPLKVDDIREVTNVARRIAAILRFGPVHDANYLAVKANTFEWSATSG